MRRLNTISWFLLPILMFFYIIQPSVIGASFQKKIIGKWEKIRGKGDIEAVEFIKEGTLIFFMHQDEIPNPVAGLPPFEGEKRYTTVSQYAFIDEGRIKVTPMPFSLGSGIVEVNISGNILTLHEVSSQEFLRFRRVSGQVEREEEMKATRYDVDIGKQEIKSQEVAITEVEKLPPGKPIYLRPGEKPVSSVNAFKRTQGVFPMHFTVDGEYVGIFYTALGKEAEDWFAYYTWSEDGGESWETKYLGSKISWLIGKTVRNYTYLVYPQGGTKIDDLDMFYKSNTIMFRIIGRNGEDYSPPIQIVSPDAKNVKIPTNIFIEGEDVYLLYGNSGEDPFDDGFRSLCLLKGTNWGDKWEVLWRSLSKQLIVPGTFFMVNEDIHIIYGDKGKEITKHIVGKNKGKRWLEKEPLLPDHAWYFATSTYDKRQVLMAFLLREVVWATSYYDTNKEEKKHILVWKRWNPPPSHSFVDKVLDKEPDAEVGHSETIDTRYKIRILKSEDGFKSGEMEDIGIDNKGRFPLIVDKSETWFSGSWYIVGGGDTIFSSKNEGETWERIGFKPAGITGPFTLAKIEKDELHIIYSCYVEAEKFLVYTHLSLKHFYEELDSKAKIVQKEREVATVPKREPDVSKVQKDVVKEEIEKEVVTEKLISPTLDKQQNEQISMTETYSKMREMQHMQKEGLIIGYGSDKEICKKQIGKYIKIKVNPLDYDGVAKATKEMLENEKKRTHGDKNHKAITRLVTTHLENIYEAASDKKPGSIESIGYSMRFLYLSCKACHKVYQTEKVIPLDTQQKDEMLTPKQKAEVETLTPKKLVLLFHALSGEKIYDDIIIKFIQEEDPGFLNRFIPKNEFERSEMEEKKAKAIASKLRELKLEMEGIVNKEYIITPTRRYTSASFGEYDFKKGGFPINYDRFYSLKAAGQVQVYNAFGRSLAIVLPENFERFSFLKMHIDKTKEFLEENPDREVKMKVYWKPMYSQKFYGMDVVGKITRVEIYSGKDELIKVLSEGEEVTKQMDIIELPESGAEQTVARWPWEQKGDVATHTPQSYTGKVYASKGSRTFHRPDCTEIGNINESELISFSSPQKALEAGGIPCDTCKPKSEVTERKTKKEPSKEPFEELIEGLKGIFGGKRK